MRISATIAKQKDTGNVHVSIRHNVPKAFTVAVSFDRVRASLWTTEYQHGTEETVQNAWMGISIILRGYDTHWMPKIFGKLRKT